MQGDGDRPVNVLRVVAAAGAREARRRAEVALAHEITVIHIASRRNYEVPRGTAHLRRRGRVVNRKRVERVMREHGIAGNSQRTGRRSLTKADTAAAPSPDLIGRDFTAGRPGTKAVVTSRPPRAALPRLVAGPGHPGSDRLLDGRPPPRRTCRRRSRHGRRAGPTGARLRDPQRPRIGIHLRSTPFQDTRVGTPAEHGQDRVLLRQRRRGEFLGRIEGRSAPASRPTGPPPAPASSTSSRPSTTDAARASTSTGATSRPTRRACATNGIRPSRRNRTVSKNTGKLQVEGRARAATGPHRCMLRRSPAIAHP